MKNWLINQAIKFLERNGFLVINKTGATVDIIAHDIRLIK